MTSFREIAKIMDVLVPPKSLRKLANIHRWINGIKPISISFREIFKRHGDHARQAKTLFYNTWLLPGVTLETFCRCPRKKRLRKKLASIGEKPIREVRAIEIADSIVEHGYDIVAMCEVFDQETRNLILENISERVDLVSQAMGPEPDKSLSISSETISELLAGIVDVPCPPFCVRRIGADPINSGLVTIGIGKTLSNSLSVAYSNRGNAYKDADYWSSKGVLRVEINLGDIGKIEIYSTHLYAGGDLLREPSEKEKNAVKRDQYKELCKFINEYRNPKNICLVMGDFNIDGMDLVNNPEYQSLVSEMGRLGFEDLWVSRALDEDDNPHPKPTTLMKEKPKRLDYIFVEKQKPEHTFILDLTRPLRILFKREVVTDDIEYLSDHTGLSINLIASPL